MQVWKFGGTSVGKPERMKSIRQLITEDGQPKIVVLSALSGSTNTLLSISESLNAGNPSEAKSKASELRAHYDQFLTELYSTPVGLGQGQAIVAKEFAFIDSLIATSPYTVKQEKEMVALGELLSTQIFEAFLQEEGISSALLPALDFMVIDEDNEPILKVIEQKLAAVLAPVKDKQIFVTQGFICRNPAGEVDNLKRGGSDYTASLIGGAIQAEEVQIWTDIDGMHNNDPRIVKNTFPIRELSFAEAAELAYFGAKILHPSTITPAKLKGVPVRLKNTMEPSAFGTLISEKSTDVEIKAIAAKDNITAIYIHSTRMLNAYGFLKRVFEVFEKYKTPIDMITTSEVAVSVTIDNDMHLDEIIAELSNIASVEIERGQTIVSIVGNEIAKTESILKKLFNAIDEVPVTMVSYGGSAHNISLLLPSDYKTKTLQLINKGLFNL